ncbi:MAG: flagellar basal body rod protein FlgB [Alphaproteobacteria bacterium]|jgi:flagellar basal body rod protein FlgB|nr:hypothetical protein [Alphaproteobacteria bacterium]
MSLGQTKVFMALSQRLSWDMKNMEVASDNLARADMSGAKEKRLKPFSFKSALSGELMRTNPQHLSSPNGGVTEMLSTKDKKKDVTITGNTISTHHEMMEFNNSTTKVYETTSLQKKFVQMYRNWMTVTK